MIWFKDYTLAEVNLFSKKTLVQHLGIEVTALNENSIEGTMPVDERTFQPMRLLHGGASCVLSESLASIGSNLVINTATHMALGQHIEATHLRPVKDGFVRGVATLIHKGSSMHMWNVQILNNDGKVVCDSKMIMAIREHQK